MKNDPSNTGTPTVDSLMLEAITTHSETRYLKARTTNLPEGLKEGVQKNLFPDEKIVDGALHIRHIDGVYRELSTTALTAMVLNARGCISLLLAEEDDEDDEDDEAPNPNPTPATNEPLTVQQYAKMFGMYMESGALEDLQRHALALAGRKSLIVESSTTLFGPAPCFPRELLREVFSTFFHMQ